MKKHLIKGFFWLTLSGVVYAQVNELKTLAQAPLTKFKNTDFEFSYPENWTLNKVQEEPNQNYRNVTEVVSPDGTTSIRFHVFPESTIKEKADIAASLNDILNNLGAPSIQIRKIKLPPKAIREFAITEGYQGIYSVDRPENNGWRATELYMMVAKETKGKQYTYLIRQVSRETEKMDNFPYRQEGTAIALTFKNLR